MSVRAADNTPDPCRDLQGYVTTYQSIAAAPDLHLVEFRRRRMLLVVDEVHHLPALSDMAPDPIAHLATPDAAAGWSRALLPLLESARIRLHLSGTLQRADGLSILWSPYRSGQRAKTFEIDLAAPGWAAVGYSRAYALNERTVLPGLFGAVDSEASWLDQDRTPAGRAGWRGTSVAERPAFSMASISTCWWGSSAGATSDYHLGAWVFAA